tara:strand:- start:940 stop:1359 length:420 start_codon:yes stop_codon:yes gene_type:complete
MKSGYKQVKTPKFGLNLKMKWCAGGLPPPDTHYTEISYECKGGCPEVEEEQPPSPDDGTAEYDIDEQLAKEKETEGVVKIFATEVKEVINDSIMKDPEVCKLIAKQHILEIIVNEIFGKDKERVDSKYYVEITSAIHKL